MNNNKMFGVEANCRLIWVQSPIVSRPKICLLKTKSNPNLHLDLGQTHYSSAFLSPFSLHFTLPKKNTTRTHFTISASSTSVGNAEYTEEPATKVKFQATLNLPGCSSSLSLLGTGVREKIFAIVGVKVYAAGLYVNPDVFSKLDSWRGRSVAELQEDPSLFSSIFQAPLEKSLQIVLVRDIDGKTFWDALDGAISPRIKSPTPVDESALLTFRSIFQGRPLKKGTGIYLSWLDPSKMLVSVSTDGIPSSVDATVESGNVSSSLFDVFFGDVPVSPSLKASVANGIAKILK
ncbi:fatty-acid-binding protein 3, chloroplastic [Humulus lupulus]|uniref:fatty-acid-binding protein 3, chloroplastic n=1 Tax=Humulus lupulus TaxID=3486 RepID=UPI002B402EAC|nr:fatty-acid-binding protein 3, chloroplastic [Humulus lupulus]XP_062087247.1 fatty-acid-binding protein 3, chloroplastic [Humulus lupulus]